MYFAEKQKISRIQAEKNPGQLVGIFIDYNLPDNFLTAIAL